MSAAAPQLRHGAHVHIALGSETHANLAGRLFLDETAEEVVYLEVGDRTPGDEGSYPDDDLKAQMVDGKWQFVHKDGSPYQV